MMNAHSTPMVGDVFVSGWGTWSVRDMEVMEVQQVTANGHYPLGMRIKVREMAVHTGSPDERSAVVDPEPWWMHVCPSDSAIRFLRFEDA